MTYSPGVNATAILDGSQQLATLRSLTVAPRPSGNKTAKSLSRTPLMRLLNYGQRYRSQIWQATFFTIANPVMHVRCAALQVAYLSIY